jgi:hypothetical protein
MKTSYYIIIAFVAFLAVCTVALFLSFKFGKEVNNPYVLKEGAKKEFALENIHVIVCESGNVNVMPDDRDYLKITYYEMGGEGENTAQNQDADAIYRVGNDTLYFHNGGINASVWLYCRNVSSIIAKNESQIYLQGANFDRLSADVDHARLEIHDKVETERGSVSIRADNATINLDNLHVEALHVEANHSRIDLYGQSKIHLFSAKLENETTLQNNRGSGTDRFEVEKDSTSKFENYN